MKQTPEKEVLPFQQRLQNQFEEYKKQYLEWQKQQERESERLKKEEDQWQLNREQERLRIIHERQVRDQNRQTDRERRQKRQEIQRLLKQQKKDLKKLHKKNLRTIHKLKKQRVRKHKMFLTNNPDEVSLEIQSSLQEQMQEIELSQQSIGIVYRALIEDFDQRPEDNFTKEDQLEQDKQLQSYKSMVEQHIAQENKFEQRIHEIESGFHNKNVETEYKDTQTLSSIEENFEIQKHLQNQLDKLYSEMEDLQMLVEQSQDTSEENKVSSNQVIEDKQDSTEFDIQKRTSF